MAGQIVFGGCVSFAEASRTTGEGAVLFSCSALDVCHGHRIEL